MSHPARAATLWVALGCAGCLDALGPDVGPLVAPPTCGAIDSNPGLDVHFQADLLDGVFADGDIDCARCHTDGGDGVRTSGFDMTSYSTVRLGGGRSGAAIVIDGNPCDSILIQKLDVSPPFGARMPRNGPPYLTAEALQMVRDWITEGALDN